MSKKQVKDIGEELKNLKIDKKKLAIDVTTGVIGAAAGYTTEQILEGLVPDSGNPLVDIPVKIGKVGISVYVGEKVTEHLNKSVNEFIDKSEEFWKEIMDELDDIDDDNVEEVFVEVEVEEVN